MPLIQHPEDYGAAGALRAMMTRTSTACSRRLFHPKEEAERVSPEYDAIGDWGSDKDVQAHMHAEIAKELGVHISHVTCAYYFGMAYTGIKPPRRLHHCGARGHRRMDPCQRGPRRRAREGVPEGPPRGAQGQLAARLLNAFGARPALPQRAPRRRRDPWPIATRKPTGRELRSGRERERE